MIKTLGIIVITLLLVGCYSANKNTKNNTEKSPDNIKEFKLSGFSNSKDLAGALNDFTKAAQYCRDIHNHYEKTSKKTEG